MTYISNAFYCGVVHAFDVLGDPVRRRILELLADGELTAGAIGATIQDEFAITQPAVSQHLKVLRDNGFASVRPDGQRRLYAVDGRALRDVDEWLGAFRRFWTPHLDALATEIARGKRSAGSINKEGNMIDVTHQINAVRRTVGARTLEAGEARVVTISQSYDTDAADLWDACTNIERIPRWFLPITGDLRVGGRYQLEGNANGTILTCDPPREFTATWECGGDVSWIEVQSHQRGFATGHGSNCNTSRTSTTTGSEFGPGAVGMGYDGALSVWPSICRRARPLTRRSVNAGWPPRTAADS